MQLRYFLPLYDLRILPNKMRDNTHGTFVDSRAWIRVMGKTLTLGATLYGDVSECRTNSFTRLLMSNEI